LGGHSEGAEGATEQLISALSSGGSINYYNWRSRIEGIHNRRHSIAYTKK